VSTLTTAEIGIALEVIVAEDGYALQFFIASTSNS
jgi:hypothetical protein